MSETIFNEQKLRKDLALEARALGIPDGSAEVFIDKTIAAVEKKLTGKKIITRGDLNRKICAELKKYNLDFAYVYKNRDKII